MDASLGGNDRQTIRTATAATIIPSPTTPNNSTDPPLSHAPSAFVVAVLVGFVGIGMSAEAYECTSVAEMDSGNMHAQKVQMSSACKRLKPIAGSVFDNILTLL